MSGVLRGDCGLTRLRGRDCGLATSLRLPPPHPTHLSLASVTDTWAPLRIVAEFAQVDGAPAIVEFVTGKLVPAALARWGALLNTRPVTGALYASRECTSFSAPVLPGAWPACAVYAPGAPTCYLGPDDAPVTVAADKLGGAAAGSGWADADTVMYVSAVQTRSCGSAGSGVLAYAAPCQRDQSDRPTIGGWGMGRGGATCSASKLQGSR